MHQDAIRVNAEIRKENLKGQKCKSRVAKPKNRKINRLKKPVRRNAENQTLINPIRTMPNKFSWILLTAVLLVYSCDSNQIFDQYKSVPNQWNKDSLISFQVTPPDSTRLYNLFINIRNTNDYKFSNLFL